MDFGARENQVRKPALPPPSWGSHFNTLASASSSTEGERANPREQWIFREAARIRGLVPFLTHMDSHYLFIPIPGP